MTVFLILTFAVMALYLVRGITRLLHDWRDNPPGKNAATVGVCVIWLGITVRVGYEALSSILH